MKLDNQFSAHDRINLLTRQWIIDKPKADVIVIHGIFEHSGRYEHEANYFNNSGFNVYSYDHRGHGRSEGERGYVDDFDELLKDFRIFINAYLELKRGQPFFIYAHSMGALITVSSLLKNAFKSDLFLGLVTTGAALKINRDLSPLLQKLSGIIAAIAPKLQTVRLEKSMLSHDPEIERLHGLDNLNYKGKTKARMGSELLKQMKYIQTKLHLFDTPFLALHGGEDHLAEKEGSELLYQKASSTDKEIKIYEGLYHELTKEFEKDEILQDMVDWMNQRLT